MLKMDWGKKIKRKEEKLPDCLFSTAAGFKIGIFFMAPKTE